MESKLAHTLYIWTLLACLCVAIIIPVVLPRAFSGIALGLSSLEILLIIFLNLFEISGLEYLVVLGVACCLAYVTVRQTFRLDQKARSQISIISCTTVGILFLLAASPLAKFGMLACIIYLALT